MSVSSLAAGRAARRHQPKPEPQPDAEFHQSVRDGENGGEPVDWHVKVFRGRSEDVVTRVVTRGDRDGSRRWSQYCSAPAEDECDVIWPTWPAKSQDEAAASPSLLADVQEYWRTAGNRLRDSAKWTVVVLGAALATVIGTSPLAGMREHRPHPIAILLGAVGLAFLGVTILLVLQVMRPHSVSFDDVQNAEKGKWWLPLSRTALCKWRMIVEMQQDLYLPCGVRCLTGLRQSMIVEEITLVALSRAAAGNVRDQAAREKFCQAQVARAARLRELRAAATLVASVGEYYALRYRSSWATYGGILCGLLATAAIVLAFAWPSQ